jgi:hypothetical protein
MDEFRASLHYGATKATSPEQNQLALFKLAHSRHIKALQNFSASGLKRQDNDLVLIESVGAAAAFKRTFDAGFASGQSIQP